MNLRRFATIAFCMAILFSATACNTSRPENISTQNSTGSGSENSSSQTLRSAQGTISTEVSGLEGDTAESADITAIKITNVKKYGESIFESANSESDLGAYKINRDTYVKLDDVFSWFKTKISYDQADHTISIGDAARASAAFYMPDLSAYPNLDEVIELPPFGLWTNSDVTDFKFVTKAVPFQDIMKKIEKRLKSEGFISVNGKQYAELTNSLSEFKQGEMENTYLKYGNEYAIQLINGGLNENKIPVVIVRMKAKSECAKEDLAENENKPSTSAAAASKQDITVKSTGITATRSEATVKYYDLYAKVDIYNINKKRYLNLNDVSMLFHTEITYNQANHTVSIGGDITQANAPYYMPDDLSAFPNLEDIIGIPPYEVWPDEGRSGGVIDFKYVTKYGSFQDLMKKIDVKVKSEGFTAATEEQYAQLTMKSHISALQQGKIENTYIKYKKGYEDFNPETIQIIDSGLNESKLPTVIVKILEG